jgi:hypothetical protein
MRTVLNKKQKSKALANSPLQKKASLPSSFVDKRKASLTQRQQESTTKMRTIIENCVV